MKPDTLTVSECLWTAEECPLADQVSIAAQRDSLCLPNLFRSKRAKPFATTGAGPTSQVHRTARELLLELFDRGAIEELSKRLEAGAARPLHSQSKEQADLAEQQYSEFLTWLSVALEDGLSVGGDAISPSDPLPSLDRWQGVLERSSLLSSSLLSLSRLRDDEDKMEVLSALHARLSGRSRALCAPGEHLAVKKFSLGVGGGGRPGPALTLALLCDPSSGFVWNVYLYDPELLLLRRKTSSGVPPVEHVLGQLLRPVLGRGHRVRVDGPAGAEGRLARSFSDLGVHLRFAPPLESAATDVEKASSPSSSSQLPRRRRQTSGIAGHLRGWTGPALLSQADPARGQPRSDVFLPGFWVTVHLACINAFVLHSLQFPEAGGRACVTAFTKALASQLAGGKGVGSPAPFGPLTGSPEQTLVTSAPGRRSANHSSGQVISMEEEEEEEGGVSSLGNRVCRKPGVCGLANSGNSCYMNAVLQCLCSTVPLVEYLLGNNTRNELAQRERAVAGAFVRLLDEVWLGRGGAAACVSGELRATVCSLHPQFDNRSQQDAQELLLLFLNALHDDLKKKGEGRQTRSSSRHGAGESTIVTRLFEGQLSYVTLCMRCDHQAHSSQVFTILSLPIPTDVYKCSLQDCLSLFFQQSTLTAGDRILCPECGVRRDTAVLTSLARPPEILMLHLKRFGCHGSDKKKLRTNVLFSLDHLDLTPYLSSPSAHHTRYSLYAVVNHTGDLDMGHYTALCHSALLRTWHQFDDASVSEVQDFLVQSPNTYILLYSRQPFRRPQIAGL